MITCIQFMSDDKIAIEDLYRHYADNQPGAIPLTGPLIEGQGLTQQMFPEDFVNHLTDTNIYFIRMQN